MGDPNRLLTSGSSDERALLDSATHDAPPSGSRDRLLTGLGLGVGVATAAATATASAATAAGAKVAAGAATTTAAAGTATATVATTATSIGIVKWIGIGFAGGLLTVGTANSIGGDAPETIDDPAPAVAEATSKRAVEPELPPAPVRGPGETAVRDEPESEPPTARFDDVPAPPVDETETGGGLAAEIASLDRARAALAAGRSKDALTELEKHDKQFGKGTLTDEASVLRIESLFAKGDRAGAASLARQFLAANARSPHASRVRSLLARATPKPRRTAPVQRAPEPATPEPTPAAPSGPSVGSFPPAK